MWVPFEVQCTTENVNEEARTCSFNVISDVSECNESSATAFLSASFERCRLLGIVMTPTREAAEAVRMEGCSLSRSGLALYLSGSVQYRTRTYPEKADKVTFDIRHDLAQKHLI